VAASDHRKTIMQTLDQLPPLHQVAQKLIALMNNDRSSAQDLEQLIRNDQALTARILKLANSSAYGKSRDIFQLSEAVVLLGHTTITNMVLGVSMIDAVPGGQDREFAARAWEHSLDCAAIAQTLAKLTGCAEPENAFVAGLLHDIGLLVQAQAVPEVLHEVVASQPEDPLAAERQAMGLNHAQVGMKLLDMWRLPLALCEAVRFHHAPKRKYQRTNPLINVVALADQLTGITGNSPYPRQARADIFCLLRDLGIETVQFDRMFKVLTESRENVRCLLSETRLADENPSSSEGATKEMAPVALYAADDRRHAWYTSVLRHVGIPVADLHGLGEGGPESQNLERIIVDFHGAAPDERQALNSFVDRCGLAPIIVGDRRHTPQDARWQAAPHLPEFFNQDEAIETLSAAVPHPA